MQFITMLDRRKIIKYGKKLVTYDVIITDERFKNHIYLYHKHEYIQLRHYLKNIIDNPDYILEDNRHEDTLIYLKNIEELGKFGRVVIKLALYQNKEHNKNSIITLMRLNERTWKQTLKNRGNIIWKKLDKCE